MEKQVEGAEDCNCSPGVYAGQLELRAGGIHLLAGEGKDRALLGYLVDAAWSALKGKINCSSLLFEKYCSALRLYWGKYVGESVPCDLVLSCRLWRLWSQCGGGTGPPTCCTHVMGIFQTWPCRAKSILNATFNTCVLKNLCRETNVFERCGLFSLPYSRE